MNSEFQHVHLACSITAARQPSGDWDRYLDANHPGATYCHAGWALLATEVFGFQSYFLEARDSTGELHGVLPLVRQKTALFGDFATSLPFFNYGGPAADSSGIAVELMDHARSLIESLGCKYLEVRDTELRDAHWDVRTDKVTMLLALPESMDKLAKILGSKLRSQARRADRERAIVRTGGSELIDDFYDVFCRNMRELGTPVYPKRFFEAILGRFATQCVLLVVYRGSQPAAGAFMILNGKTAEIPWASCRPDAKATGFNMKLYWEVLRLATERGCALFDFGRSTVGSSTMRFKAQWGAVPKQLYWYRWERNPSPSNQPVAHPGTILRAATTVWQKLPLTVANVLGPAISPGLPW